MKAPSSDEHRRQTAELIRAFLASATSAFGPLVSAPTANWSVRVEQIASQDIVEVAPECVSGFFFVTCSFSNPLVEGYITFGDRELTINTVIGPTKRICTLRSLGMGGCRRATRPRATCDGLCPDSRSLGRNCGGYGYSSSSLGGRDSIGNANSDRTHRGGSGAGAESIPASPSRR